MRKKTTIIKSSFISLEDQPFAGYSDLYGRTHLSATYIMGHIRRLSFPDPTDMENGGGTSVVWQRDENYAKKIRRILNKDLLPHLTEKETKVFFSMLWNNLDVTATANELRMSASDVHNTFYGRKWKTGKNQGKRLLGIAGKMRKLFGENPRVFRNTPDI